MNLTFSVAQASDIPVIFSQARNLIEAYEDLDTIDCEKVFAWMQRKLTQHISAYTCVYADGVKCAWYRLCPDGELDDLYVLPAFQGRGIGSQILKDCIQKSENPLYLYVFSRNTRAVSFYERFGFSVSETVGNTRLIMTRRG